MEKKRIVIRKNERSLQELKNLGTKSKGQIFVFCVFKVQQGHENGRGTA